MILKKWFKKKTSQIPALGGENATLSASFGTPFKSDKEKESEIERFRKENLEKLERYYKSDEYLLELLASSYDSYIKDVVEDNYRTGKIEELHYCTGISSENAEKIRNTYKEELDPILALFKEPEGTIYSINKIDETKNSPDFKYFIDFIDKNKLYGETIVTDKVFNSLNNYFRNYATEYYGDRLSGRCSFYHLTYDNYLTVKQLYPEDVNYFSGISFLDETNSARFYNFKAGISFYLAKTEGTYMT